MPIALYFDVNVNRAVATALRKQGVDVLLAQEDGQHETSDVGLLERGAELGRVIFTCDDDFLVLAHHYQGEGLPFAGVIYAHQLRLTVGQMVSDLALIAQAAEPEDMVSQVEYLPL